eukprot:SAG31_NODE_3020_length_4783_cov_23.090521_1_plen_73_part_00
MKGRGGGPNYAELQHAHVCMYDRPISLYMYLHCHKGRTQLQQSWGHEDGVHSCAGREGNEVGEDTNLHQRQP